MHEESDYKAAYEGRVGADRMGAKLGIIPDPIHGDLDEVVRLREALEFIASDVRCCSLDNATQKAREALAWPKCPKGNEP